MGLACQSPRRKKPRRRQQPDEKQRQEQTRQTQVRCHVNGQASVLQSERVYMLLSRTHSLLMGTKCRTTVAGEAVAHANGNGHHATEPPAEANGDAEASGSQPAANGSSKKKSKGEHHIRDSVCSLHPTVLVPVPDMLSLVTVQARKALQPRHILPQCPSAPCSQTATSPRGSGSPTRMSAPPPALTLLCLPSLFIPRLPGCQGSSCRRRLPACSQSR